MSQISILKEKFKKKLESDHREAVKAMSSKESQRLLLLDRKTEIVAKSIKWIEQNKYLLDIYCRKDVPKKDHVPNLRVVLCEEQWQHDLWRIIKLTHWSMPPNEYIGRRKRFLVFDGDYLLGLVGLASCIWGLAARDNWIGWDVEQKREKINYVLDAYVLGAIPPYNAQYRGSKLLAYILASDTFREVWRKKYGYSPASVVTTTLFGHSAVLNRLKHNNEKLWHHLGYTRGLGTMHFSLQTIDMAKELLFKAKIIVPDRLQSGPNWKLRLMRTAIEFTNLSANKYLMHGYKRGVYLMNYADNSSEFLRGENQRLHLNHYMLPDLVASWSKDVMK